MLPPRCFTCGHVLANLELDLEEQLYEIDNNINLDDNERAIRKKQVINNLLPDRWNKRYCCRSRLISYVDLIKIII
jgi:DNA-directed RNA polymerase subunit N (RpoN/RPB10)